MKIINQYKGLQKEIYILTIGKMVTAMGSFVWPILSFFMTLHLQLDDATTALIMAGFMIFSLPINIIGGKITDKIGRKKVIVIFDLLTVFLYTLTAILPKGIISIVLIFFAGSFQTIEGPAYDALTADFSTSKTRDKAYSLTYLGFNLGYISGASLAGILFNVNVSLCFLLNAASILISTILIWIFVRDNYRVVSNDEIDNIVVENEYEKPVDANIPYMSILKKAKVIFGYIGLSCLVSLAYTAIGTLVPLQLKTNLGEYGATIYGYLSSVNGLVVILFTPIFTILLKKVPELLKILLSLVFYGISMVLFGFNVAIASAFIAMIVYTFGEVVNSIGSQPYIGRRIPLSHRGRIIGFLNGARAITSFISQLLISGILLLTKDNYSLIWGIYIIFIVIAFIMNIFIKQLDKKRFPKLYD